MIVIDNYKLVWTQILANGVASTVGLKFLCQTSTGRIIANDITSNTGIYYSDDSGSTWTPSNPLPSECTVPDGYDGTLYTRWSSDTYYHMTTNDNRLIINIESLVYYSDDNGETWTPFFYSANLSGFRILSNGKYVYGGRPGSMFGNGKGITIYDPDTKAKTTVYNSGLYAAIKMIGTRLIAFDRFPVRSTQDDVYYHFPVSYSDDNGDTWYYGANATGSNLIGVLPEIIVTPTGRLIVSACNGDFWGTVGSQGLGIRYSDDNGETWATSNILSITDDYHRVHDYCIRDNKLFAIDTHVSRENGQFTTETNTIIYSDDNGETWYPSKDTIDCLSLMINNDNNLILAVRASDNAILYAVPTVMAAREKYLDQNGAQEIVTQFQAYCDSLVGGGE